jgi:hypothetical protein
LLEKIKNLPPERTAEVEDFVDFLALFDGRDQSGQSHAPLTTARTRPPTR